jgi:hypothetical protein
MRRSQAPSAFRLLSVQEDGDDDDKENQGTQSQQAFKRPCLAVVSAPFQVMTDAAAAMMACADAAGSAATPARCGYQARHQGA